MHWSNLDRLLRSCITTVGLLLGATTFDEVYALGIYQNNPVGNMSVVSPPEGPPVSNTPGLWAAVPGLSTLVQSRSGDNLEITVSAEVYTTAAVWLRAVVDGQPQEPDVVFKAGGENWDGIRSFNFVKKNVPGGTRTIGVQWYTNPDTVAQLRDRSLVVNSASPSWGTGRLAVAVPVSGPDVVKTTSTWEDVPGLSTTLRTTLPGNFRITFSAEADADSGRFFARALIDNQPTADVLFDAAGNDSHSGTRSYTFFKSNVAAGTHTVKIQWLSESGHIRVGDRTLAVMTSPVSTTGGGLAGSQYEGPPTAITSTSWVNLPNAQQSFTTNEPSTNVQVSFGAETATSNGRLFLRALVDGEPLSPGDITYVAAGENWRAQSYSFIKKNVLPGTHTVQLQVAVDSGATGYIADRFVSILFKRRAGADFGQPYAGMFPKRGEAPPILAIGFDPVRPGEQQPTMIQLVNILRGDDGGPSMRGWYEENSRSRFVPDTFTFLGWYLAPPERQGNWYWDTGNFGLMWQDAIVAADPHFNYVQYDTNGDGVISADELTVIIVRPQNSPYGTVRGVDAPVDGATLWFDVVDMYISAQAANRVWNVGTLSHEVAHAILGAVDMYSGYTTRPGLYSIMDEHSQSTHLDPFHKLKNGFLTPDVVEINEWATRTVSLAAVETKGEITIVYTPSKNDKEYFILENRWKGAGPFNYDAGLPAEGIVVWHIIEDIALTDQFPPPGICNPARPEDSCGWDRKGVRRLAVLSNAGATVELQWADGTSSKIKVMAEANPREFLSTEIAKLP
jgi:M6 family metalloprotease-like protein